MWRKNKLLLPLHSKRRRRSKKKLIRRKKRVKTKMINCQQECKILERRSSFKVSLKTEEINKIFKHNMNLIKTKTIKSMRISRTKTWRKNSRWMMITMSIKKIEAFEAFFRTRAKATTTSNLEISNRFPLKLTLLFG